MKINDRKTSCIKFEVYDGLTEQRYGKCATCVLVNKKYNVIRNPMDEHTNMC